MDEIDLAFTWLDRFAPLVVVTVDGVTVPGVLREATGWAVVLASDPSLGDAITVIPFTQIARIEQARRS